MNPVQEKIVEAVHLLLEARALAKTNAEAYATEHKPTARRFEDVVFSLRSNVSLTLDNLIDMAARIEVPLLMLEGDVKMLEKDQEWLFRRNKEFLS
jgi:hypothetical protein